MKKNCKKPLYDPVKAMVVKKTALAFGVTESYVRLVDKGDRQNEEIKKSFNELYQKITSAANA